GDLGLFHVGAAVLGCAFLIKCAMWPLGFWLTPTYAAASAPAAAVFAILSKVGVYVIIRLSLLVFSAGAGASAGFGLTWLLFGGGVTIVFGTFGMIASRDLARAAGFGVMISSGTILAIVGIGSQGAIGGALFYLVGSTLACAALFLLAEILQRGRQSDVGAARAVFDDEYRDPFDDQERNEPGLVIPAAVAALGGAFLICTLMVAGMPPLAGFVGKLAMVDALVREGGAAQWSLIAVLSLSSLGVLIALTRLGVGAIWTRDEDAPDVVVGAAELTAVAGLLGACVLLAVFAGPALTYADHTAAWLSEPQSYIRSVLSVAPPSLLLAVLIALAAPAVMLAMRVERVHLKSLGPILPLAVDVVQDVVRSNWAVTQIILAGRRRERTSGFIHVPLDLRDRYGLAVLAVIITSTPGTLWVEYEAQTGRLLLHVLDLVDEETWAILFWGLGAAQLILICAMGLAAWRIIKGPRAQDRVLGMDTLYLNGMLLVVTYGVRTGSNLYLEAALIIGMLGFAATVAMAKFLMRGERVHAPTLGATLGMALILTGSVVWFSVAEGRFLPREILIGLFLTVTTPVTLILLARAALFRDRTEENSQPVPEAEPEQS
ncbi:hypothetical protein LTR94_025239, partial [Friedmanniomyces endolithicus]